MDTWDKYDAERAALIEDLAGLEASQWDAQSLCSSAVVLPSGMPATRPRAFFSWQSMQR